MRVLLAVLAAVLLSTPQYPPPVLEQVLETGRLTVITRNAPTAYYIGSDGPTGPEYDLVAGFSRDLGVALDMPPLESFGELVPAVARGDAHMAAGGLSITEQRLGAVRFSQPFQQVEQHLIYRRGTGRPQSVEDLQDGQIVVVNGSSHADTMRALASDLPMLQWREDPDPAIDAADLLEQVAEGEIDYTVVDSTDFSIHRHFHPELRIAFELEVADSIAWAFPPGTDGSLITRANQYLQKIRRNGELTRILDRYYGHNDEFDYVGTRNFIRHFESRLPRYRDMFENAGAEWGVDWRLLAAIGYQESHWRSQAVSPTGVRGIMMLTQATAEFLGIDNRADPRNSIFGGAEYYARQTERVADDVPEPDRTWMALAAYNVGFYHLKDAQQIVEWRGGDPNAWIDVADALPLLAQRKWYSRLPYGYARGWEPVLYVNNIRSYYNILKWLTANEAAEEAERDIEQASAGEPADTA